MPPTPSAWVAIGAATTPGFSKDGGTIFHLRGAGLPQVWAMDRTGGNARALTRHDEKVGFLRRSPADDRLIWGIDAGGDERQQLWTLAPGAAPAALTDAPGAIHDFGAFSPDGSRIAYTANDRDECCFDVLCQDLATGAVTRLYETAGGISVSGWSSTADRLVATVERSSSDQALWIIEAAGGAARAVPHAGLARFASVRWTSDGTALMGLTDQGGADFMRLCRIDPDTGAAEPVFAPAGRDVEAWSLSPDGGALLATVENDRGWSVLRVGPPDADRPVVAGLPALVGDLAWAPDGRALAFTAQGPAEPPGIWLWDASGGRAAPVWRPDPHAEAGVQPGALVTPELVSWTSFDGTRIEGWFARPGMTRQDAGHPAVVWVHGGPASQTRPNLRPDIQMLLAQGFAVLMPNVRGSTGYGRAFMESDDFDRRPDRARRSGCGPCLARRAARHRCLAHRHHGAVLRRLDGAGRDHPAPGAVARRGRLLWHRRFRHPAARYRALAPRPPRARIRRSLTRDAELVRPHLADPSCRARHRAAAGLPWQPRPARADDRERAVRRGDGAAQKKVRYERFDYAGHGFIRPDHRRRVWTAVAEHFATHLRGDA